ncbi:MAG: hypothetical protein JO293_04935 [Candidatus Eremiobacteraeota bacterium]|nr:hypothetical protein [Candidatus Eremiobacteraeota bacterium]MBV8222683.1 hypothetical protein [Candidatus Eremiobacteraeota bacterium]MBV8282268.1 hypothetical protein [Candidatus Eremiobacteraeota bacterium]
MMSRLRDQFFYAGLAVVWTAVYSALVPLRIGRELRRNASNRVARARRRVMKAGASFVRRLRSA